MPSKAYWYFSDEDLGSVIAYVKSAPPVDNVFEGKNLKVLGRVMIAAGAFGDVFAAEVLDHYGSRPSSPQRGVNPVYGEYMVNTGDCANCHGAISDFDDILALDDFDGDGSVEGVQSEVEGLMHILADALIADGLDTTGTDIAGALGDTLTSTLEQRTAGYNLIYLEDDKSMGKFSI